MGIKEKLREILAEIFDVGPDDIHAGTTFEELGADELDFVELAWIFEDEFDPGAIDASELGGLDTVGQMQMYIQRKVNTPGE